MTELDIRPCVPGKLDERHTSMINYGVLCRIIYPLIHNWNSGPLGSDTYSYQTHELISSAHSLTKPFPARAHTYFTP